MTQRRKEFLELWTSHHPNDDFWLQVAIRHLCGRYLPVSVIRRTLRWPDGAEALLAIAELWPMLTFDDATNRVGWKRARFNRKRNLWIERAVLLILYTFFGTMAFLAFSASFSSPALSAWAVIFAINGVTLSIVSVALLAYDGRLAKAINAGPKLLSRLNSERDPDIHTAAQSTDGCQ